MSSAIRSAITALSRRLDFLRQRVQYRPGTAVPSTVLISDMGDGSLLLEDWRDGPSPVIREDLELLTELVRLSREITSLAMHTMEGSASVAEQQNHAERLIAVG